MDHGERVDHVEHDLHDLIAAVAAGPLDVRVPTCPDFSVDQLAHHVGTFCGFWTHVLAEGASRPKRTFRDFAVEPPGATAPEARADWLTGIGDALVADLRATPPDTPVWTWFPPDQSAGFVARRCSHELSVHRVDLQLARGGPAEPIAGSLAADGIEEILFVLFQRVAAQPPDDRPATPATLRLRGTDVQPSEWLVTLGPEGVEATRADAATAIDSGTATDTAAPERADFELRGTVSDLELVLYQRPANGEVEQVGDPSVLDRFHREFTFG